MKTNHGKMRILPILDEIIAYFHNKSRISKNQQQNKLHFSTTVAKKAQNLKILVEVIAYLRNQLQKIVRFKKSAEEGCFNKISAYLRSQFKQTPCISKNQP